MKNKIELHHSESGLTIWFTFDGKQQRLPLSESDLPKYLTAHQIDNFKKKGKKIFFVTHWIFSQLSEQANQQRQTSK